MYLSSETITIPSPTLVPPQYRVCQTLLDKGSGGVNEDALAVGNKLCIVCDGSTGLDGGELIPGSSGAQQAAEITAAVFNEDIERDLHESAQIANEAIRARMQEYGVDCSQREHLWSTSFAAVQLSGRGINWCQIGDCLILLIYEDGRSKLLGDLPGHDEQILAHWQKIGPRAVGTIHQVMGDQIAAVRRTMNRAFGALNGEAEALEFLVQGRIEDDRISDVLLFSDGFFPPTRFPDKPLDTKKLVDLYKTSGLTGVRDHIRVLQSNDPGCYLYPRFKMFDDISAIALQKS